MSVLDNFEPKVDSQLTVKNDADLRLWLANQFARLKNEFYGRKRYLRLISGSFSTTTISTISHVLDTFTISANNFITASTILALSLFGSTTSTAATKTITVRANGTKIGEVTGLGSTNNSFNLSIELVCINSNGQTAFGVAIVSGLAPVVSIFDTSIDFTKDVTFSILGAISISSSPSEIILKQLSLTYSGKVVSQGVMPS